jgi:hypothetical protein
LSELGNENQSNDPNGQIDHLCLETMSLKVTGVKKHAEYHVGNVDFVEPNSQGVQME